jgi:1-phosphatidylinositol-3-phosphate 5-kinase
MRFAFQRAEQALYSQLRDTPNGALNNARREFYSAAHGARRRLAAWEAKHVSKNARSRLAADREAIQEPRWWHAGWHAVPGGNVIVKEEDWGSIIAFTLRYVPPELCLSSKLTLGWFVPAHWIINASLLAC